MNIIDVLSTTLLRCGIFFFFNNIFFPPVPIDIYIYLECHEYFPRVDRAAEDAEQKICEHNRKLAKVKEDFNAQVEKLQKLMRK